MDRYWYSPQGKKLRSLKEVVRFLEDLEKNNGDEDKAKKKKETGKIATPKTHKSPSKTSKSDTSASKHDSAKKGKPQESSKGKATKPKASNSAPPPEKPQKKKSLSMRDRRRPLIEFTEKLESIWKMVESRPNNKPFMYPVSRREYPEYFDTIEKPIDLSGILKKLQTFQYTTYSSFLNDFELMKANAIKFNGEDHEVAKEGVGIYEAVHGEITKDERKLQELEQAIKKAGLGEESGKGADTKVVGENTADGEASQKDAEMTEAVGGETLEGAERRGDAEMNDAVGGESSATGSGPNADEEKAVLSADADRLAEDQEATVPLTAAETGGVEGKDEEQKDSTKEGGSDETAVDDDAAEQVGKAADDGDNLEESTTKNAELSEETGQSEKSETASPDEGNTVETDKERNVEASTGTTAEGDEEHDDEKDQSEKKEVTTSSSGVLV